MTKRAHQGFLAVDDALNMDQSDIRKFPMRHQHGMKVELAELLGATEMFVKGENNTL